MKVPNQIDYRKRLNLGRRKPAPAPASPPAIKPSPLTTGKFTDTDGAVVTVEQGKVTSVEKPVTPKPATEIDLMAPMQKNAPQGDNSAEGKLREQQKQIKQARQQSAADDGVL